MILQPVTFSQFSGCKVNKDFFISGSYVLDHFGMDVVVIERLSQCFQKKRRKYSSSSKVKSQLKWLSHSNSGLSECRDCCKVFSTCSLNSSLKRSFSKCFPVEKTHGLYLLCLFQQSGICSLSTTGKLKHLRCPSKAY